MHVRSEYNLAIGREDLTQNKIGASSQRFSATAPFVLSFSPFSLQAAFTMSRRGLGPPSSPLTMRPKRGSCQIRSYLTVEIFSTILPRSLPFAVEIAEKIQPRCPCAVFDMSWGALGSLPKAKQNTAARPCEKKLHIATNYLRSLHT